MVLSSEKANSKNKVNDTTRRKHRRAQRSPNKSSSRARSTSSASEELDISSIRWPSKREDCAWMAGKVALSKRGGRRVAASSATGASDRDSLSSASSSTSVDAPWKGRHRGAQGSRRKSMTTNMSPSSAVSNGTFVPTSVRQPLGTITNAHTSSAGTSSSPYRPACTIPATWHRALSKLVLQAEKERSTSIAS